MGERNDLANQMPEQAEALAAKLDAYLTRIEAQMPLPNPDYDPAAVAPAPARRKKKTPNRPPPRF